MVGNNKGAVREGAVAQTDLHFCSHCGINRFSHDEAEYKNLYGCKVLTESSVTRVTRVAVRHHEARRAVTRVTEFSVCTEEPLWILVLAYYTLPSTIAFRLEYVLLYKFCAKITTFFFIKKGSVRLLSSTLTSKRLTENVVKMTSRLQR